MITAAVTWEAEILPTELPARATRVGRRCFPLPLRAYWAYGTILGSKSWACSVNCRVTDSKNGSSGSTRAFQERCRLKLGLFAAPVFATFGSAASIRKE